VTSCAPFFSKDDDDDGSLFASSSSSSGFDEVSWRRRSNGIVFDARGGREESLSSAQVTTRVDKKYGKKWRYCKEEYYLI
jgi:hypothetical protein